MPFLTGKAEQIDTNAGSDLLMMEKTRKGKNLLMQRRSKEL